MALATVTGSLSDFGRTAIPGGSEPSLHFVPSSPGTSDGRLLVSDPVRADLESSGAFTIEVEECDLVEPSGFHYVAEVTYYRDGKPLQTDSFWRTPIFVPPGGGPLRDILKALPQPGAIVWAAGKPTRRDVVWIDYTDVTSEGVQVYAPRKA